MGSGCACDSLISSFICRSIGGLGGIHSGLEVGFLNEVAPAGVTIFRTLAGFEVLHFKFGVFLAFDHQHHPTRLVSPDVMADDGV